MKVIIESQLGLCDSSPVLKPRNDIPDVGLVYLCKTALLVESIRKEISRYFSMANAMCSFRSELFV